MLGKRVMLREDHPYPHLSASNPTNMLGFIIEFYSVNITLPITVKWANGITNSYEESDLIFIDGIDPIKYIKKHELV